jgi:hypothetical protein
MANHRKFTLGDIATTRDGAKVIVVDHRMIGTQSQYRVIGTDPMKRRVGAAKWYQSYLLTPIGEHSWVGAVRTYRANEKMGEDRGCFCHCCIHTSMDSQDFTNKGRWRHDESN